MDIVDKLATNSSKLESKSRIHTSKTPIKWRPHGDSNPGYRRERANLIVVLITLFVSLLTFCGQIHANTFFEIGTVYKGMPPPMDWWQPGMPTQATKVDIYLRAGLEKKLTQSLSTRASAQFLGCNDIKALATPDEDHYIQGSGGMCTHGSCRPPDLYQTRGCVGGVGASVVYRYKKVFGEAGPTFNVQNFDLTSSALHEDSQYHGRPESKYTYKDTNAGLGYMVGLGVDVGGFNFGGYLYVHGKSSKFKDPNTEEAFPSGMKKTYAVALRYSF